MVLLDREPLALQCALLNAALNGLPAAQPSAAAVAAAAADSGGSGASVQPPSLAELLPHLKPADAQLLEDWRAQQGQQGGSHEQASSRGSSAGGGDPGPSSASSANSSAGRPGLVRVEVFDWSQPVTLAPHDVMLVCDCLYESFSVEVSGQPVCQTMPHPSPSCLRGQLLSRAPPACRRCIQPMLRQAGSCLSQQKDHPAPRTPQPVAAVAPKLLSRRGSARLLLADPPDRARHNR